jgi:hypothetical protein
MQNLLRAIPSKEEYEGLTEEQKEFLSMSLATLRKDHPREGVDYSLEEMMALTMAKHGYVLDLVAEFNLAVDYNE